MSSPSSRLSAEMVTAISAVVAALIALAIGVWENAEMRRHNRLSVVPHLDFTARVSSADTLARREGVIWLSNEGVGPARIDEFRFRIHADRNLREFDSWGAAIPTFENMGVKVQSRAETRAGLMLGTDRRLELIRFVTADTSTDPLLQLLSRLQIVVDYSSVYGEPFTATFNAAAALSGTDAEDSVMAQ